MEGTPKQNNKAPTNFEVIDVQGKPMKVVGYTAPEGNPGRMKILEDMTEGDSNEDINDQQTNQFTKIEAERKIFTYEDAKAAFQTLTNGDPTELFRKIRIRNLAREKGVSPEQISREINLYAVSEIHQKEKGELRHFHRTSVNNVVNIIQMGRILSRSKLKELRPDIQSPGWSSSDNVLMTRDKFDRDGNLIMPGFVNEGDSFGASGNGAVLVFKDSIMQDGTYSAIESYPSVSDLPIQEHCEVILVDSEEDRGKIEQVLKENSFSIPIMLKSEWKR